MPSKKGRCQSKSLSEIAVSAHGAPLVRRDGDGNIDIDFIRDGKRYVGYWIKETDVDTERKLIMFLRHLSGKAQLVSPAHFTEMIDVGMRVIAKNKTKDPVMKNA